MSGFSIGESSQPSILLNFSSQDATYYLSNLNSYFKLVLPSPITASADEHIYMSLYQITIPFSFKGINSLNNIVDIEEVSVSDPTDKNVYSITFRKGNYTIEQIIESLTTAMNNTTTLTPDDNTTCSTTTRKVNSVIIQYDSIVNGLKFESLSDTYKIRFLYATGANANISMDKPLGFKFNLDTDYFQLDNPLRSNRGVACSFTKSIYIRTDKTSANSINIFDGVSSVLARIPVNTFPNQYILSNANDNPFALLLTTQMVNDIQIALTDSNGNLLDFSECVIDFSLLFQFTKNSNYKEIGEERLVNRLIQGLKPLHMNKEDKQVEEDKKEYLENLKKQREEVEEIKKKILLPSIVLTEKIAYNPREKIPNQLEIFKRLEEEQK